MGNRFSYIRTKFTRSNEYEQDVDATTHNVERELLKNLVDAIKCATKKEQNLDMVNQKQTTKSQKQEQNLLQI